MCVLCLVHPTLESYQVVDDKGKADTADFDNSHEKANVEYVNSKSSSL